MHSGTAVVGNVGGKKRFEYTAHGDVVNTAARLEGANRHLGTRVCISRITVGDQDRANFRPVGSVIVKGRSEPLEVVTAWNDLDEESRREYLDAFETMANGGHLALQRFETLSASLPEDRLVALHVSRLQARQRGVTIELQEK